MAPVPMTPRRNASGRARGRPKGSVTGTGARRKATFDVSASEQPPKKRRYVPGGPGGGGRFVDENGVTIPAPPSGATTAARVRASASHAPNHTPSTLPVRERSTRIRTAVNRDEMDEMENSSAAAVAAAVVQNEGYKPREERGWEEFHPNLDIDAPLMVYRAENVDGIAKTQSETPFPNAPVVTMNASDLSVKEGTMEAGSRPTTPLGQGKPSLGATTRDTTPRKRIIRPSRDSVSLYARRPSDLGTAPKVPQVLPISNQTPKERLDLKMPSYRKTDRVAQFESKTFGQARYVDKSMMNAGYQASDQFTRPEPTLIKAIEANADEDVDCSMALSKDGDAAPNCSGFGRVEYDMDEQDDIWLEKHNQARRSASLDLIPREVFEITLTKIEKEWNKLEKRIPKPNPRPPQTHRPRSSSAAAVNGEPQVGEEQDSKCAICDDGDCENTNAIVFCDGCNLAVHQECYGVPYIPEGQWMCRKCQLIGRGIPTCIFCPNTDGAFKQTNSAKWAHLLCAMWIPEISLGNHTFMEPVMEVEKVPKSRWKLCCYICEQPMGACIQCSNKNCYQAFHPTCARRSKLFLKMKNSQGALAVLDGSMPLKAFCDKHCPPDYAKHNGVAEATKLAMKHYKRRLESVIWADNQASAQQIAATHRHAITDHPPDESQLAGAQVSAVLAEKKKGQQGVLWKLPSGAPIIPQAVFDLVENSLQRFTVLKKRDWIAHACKYWTLKREQRRGAPLLKRLQLPTESFNSMEILRRNFATMTSGRDRLARRVEFCSMIVDDLSCLKQIADSVQERERIKLEMVELEQEFVESSYFPVSAMLAAVAEKAISLDKNVFKDGLSMLQERLGKLYYTTTFPFVQDLAEVFRIGIEKEPAPGATPEEPRFEHTEASPNKHVNYSDVRDRRKLARRIVKAISPQLSTTYEAEAQISNKPAERAKEISSLLEASLEAQQPTITVAQENMRHEQMADTAVENQIIVAHGDADVNMHATADEPAGLRADMDVDMDAEGDLDNSSNHEGGAPGGGSIQVNTSTFTGSGLVKEAKPYPAGSVQSSGSPPSVNGYQSVNPESMPQSDPLTPPRSNGSFGQVQADVLNEGGQPWYLQRFDLQGTTAVDEQWTGRDAVRGLSEELTDMDEDDLNNLQIDVDDDTITASTVEATTTTSAPAAVAPSRKRAGSNLGTAPRYRKGVRSSTRRR